MRPVTVSQTGVGATNPIPLALSDHSGSGFSVGIGVKVSGTATYSVQHTFDDPFAASFVAASATWYNHADLTSKTANADGAYAAPVRAIRLNVTAGTGTVTMTAIQAGI